jgi:hypothetical protein
VICSPFGSKIYIGVMVTGVPNGSRMKRGVSVGGARVGTGACVGVAMRVLTGRAKVGGTVGGGANVGRSTVGIDTTTVAAEGVATSEGRMTKLAKPSE